MHPHSYTNEQLADALDGLTSKDRINSSILRMAAKALRESSGGPNGEAVTLLRAWVSGCGDEHFSTKEQCRELLERSGTFLVSLGAAGGSVEPLAKALIEIALMPSDPDPWVEAERFDACREIAMKALNWSVMPSSSATSQKGDSDVPTD